MAKGNILLILVLAVLSCSCASVQQKKFQALSRDVYATQAALSAGRFDRAKQYSQEATRLVAPPKKAIVVKPVESQGKQYITLPEEFEAVPALNLNSPAGKAIVNEDPALQKQIKEEDKTLAAQDKEETKVIAEAVAQASKEKSKGFWSFLHLGFFGHLILFSPIILLLIGAVLCIFFPALLPLLLGIFNDCRGAINWGFGMLAEALAEIKNLWSKK